MDDAPLRRGVPTSHVRFGEATAILAGDALLTEGLAVLARYPADERYAAAKVSVLDVVTRAIGSEGMIGGQVADLEAEKEQHPSEDLVARIHESKTGRLIRAALAVGGLLSFAEDEDLDKLDSYGRAIGLAFQGSTLADGRSASPFRSATTCSTSSRTPRLSARKPGPIRPRRS